jgi:hypothetical protein
MGIVKQVEKSAITLDLPLSMDNPGSYFSPVVTNRPFHHPTE